jgi:hypothetical protein
MSNSKGQKTILAASIMLGVAALMSTPALAEGPMLTAAEINTLMSGNSVDGAFPDGVTLYRQNNHADGIAVVVVKGDKIRNIPWEAVEKEGVGYYCEDWSADDWGTLCFTVTREDQMHPVFKNESGTLIPTTWTSGFIDLNHPE